MTHKSDMMPQAAIIGCNWGLVHLAPLRAAGFEITALLDLDPERARRLAREHHIHIGTHRIADLGSPDLLVIASPAASHSYLIQAFPDSFIITEKPLLGFKGDPWLLHDDPENVWVNYAFAQLETAQLVQQHISEPVTHVRLETYCNLDLNFTTEEWFFEVSSHPLSWLLHWLGPPRICRREILTDRLELELECSRALIELVLEVSGEPGIYHDIVITTSEQEVSLSGCYQPGMPWRFEPVRSNGVALNQGEFTDTDCWIDANLRSLQLLVQRFRGEISSEEALSRGGFNQSKALWIEQCLRDDV